MITRPNPDLMFRAFADRTRLRILHLLALRSGLCVCDLVGVLRLPQSRVSRHLAYLRRAGLVLAREQGRWSCYSLASTSERLHRRLFACVRGCFGDVPAFRLDQERLRRAKNLAGCQ